MVFSCFMALEFELWGYREVTVPTLELAEVTPGAEPGSSRVETYSSEMLYRLFDRKGRVLVLRPDITEPVARMACSDQDLPQLQRFSYFGNAFRQRQAGTGQPHEIWQAGFEIIGVLEELSAIIEQRKRDMPEGSYVTKLVRGGPPAVARKVGEEAVETILAALGEDDSRLISEVADLWFHSLVLLAARGRSLDDVCAELAARRKG